MPPSRQVVLLARLLACLLPGPLRAQPPALHPGDEITPYAAAALTEFPLAAAERGLAAFFDRNLLDQPLPGRYRFHDLVRVFARELADTNESPADRAVAVDWLEDYYLVSAYSCEQLVATHGRHESRPVEYPPADIPQFAGAEQARSWPARPVSVQ